MLSTLYPAYGVSLVVRSEKGRRIRLRPSKIFVDMPWIVYSFAGYIVNKIAEADVSAKEVKDLWNEVVEKNKELLTVDGKPYVTVGLKKHSFSPNLVIVQIRVNWRKFFEFYERVSEDEASKIIKNGSYIREIYNDIIFNTLWSASIKAFEIKFTLTERLLLNFVKVLKYSGDYYQVEEILNNILSVIDKLHQQLSEKYCNWELFTWQLKSDWIKLHESWERIDIPACYFYLRNVLELFLKIALYKFLLSNFSFQKNIEEVLIRVLFEAERTKKLLVIRKKEDYSTWKQNFLRVLTKVADKISNLLSITNEIEKEKQYRRLIEKLNRFCPSISSKLIEFIKDDLKVESSVESLWTICSEIIHNQPPLPFYSLYEIKIFKRVLKYYLEQISLFCKKCFEIPLKDKFEYETATFPRLRFNIIKKQIDLLWNRYRDRIKDGIKEISSRYSKEFWFDPRLLSIIFEIWELSPSRMYEEEISYEDFLFFIENLQAISYKVGLKESAITTFQIFEKELKPFLFSLGLNKDLSEEERRVLLILLLSLLLPESIK
jgi:hypothetical protein